MITKEYKISEIIDSMASGEIILSPITLGDNDTSVTITSSNIQDALYNYSEWSVITKTVETGGVMPITHPFKDLWERFININKHSYDRVTLALYTEYSPIDNYDKHSEITHIKGEQKTTNVIAERNDESNIPIHTVHEYETSVDNLTPNESRKSTADAYIDKYKRGGGTDTSTQQTYTDTDKEYTHGNIGVAKSSDIAKEEVIFRLTYNLITIIIDDFIRENCYLFEG